ncbi:MAG: response regulator, partial [Bacteroidota bacterium]
MEKGNILIVDDEEDILLSLQMFLSIYFDQVDTEARPTQLPNRLEARSYDLILLDMNFKKGETSGDAGLKWLSKIKELSPHTSV